MRLHDSISINLTSERFMTCGAVPIYSQEQPRETRLWVASGTETRSLPRACRGVTSPRATGHTSNAVDSREIPSAGRRCPRQDHPLEMHAVPVDEAPLRRLQRHETRRGRAEGIPATPL